MPSTTAAVLDREGEEEMSVMRPFSKLTVRFLWREWPSNTRALVIVVLAMAVNALQIDSRGL